MVWSSSPSWMPGDGCFRSDSHPYLGAFDGLSWSGLCPHFGCLGDGLSRLVLSLKCLRSEALNDMVFFLLPVTDPLASFSTNLAQDYMSPNPSVKILFGLPSFLTPKF